jgi:hypothetical protein
MAGALREEGVVDERSDERSARRNEILDATGVAKAQRKTWFSHEWEELLERRGEKEGKFGDALGRFKYLWPIQQTASAAFSSQIWQLRCLRGWCLPILFASPPLPACLALLPCWISKWFLKRVAMAQGYRIKRIPQSMLSGIFVAVTGYVTFAFAI